MTAPRRPRSAGLLVGSRPWWWANVHGAGQILSRSREAAASAGHWLIITSSQTKPLPPLADAGPGNAQSTARAQARDELALERAAALHEQRLVDRLVRDPHRRIIREVDRQAARDLLRTP